MRGHTHTRTRISSKYCCSISEIYCYIIDVDVLGIDMYAKVNIILKNNIYEKGRRNKTSQ